jgi:succinoglycan biosynthesis protein ExoA
MSGEIEVSVLIPVFNEEANLRAVAEAALAQELDGEAEFLFIDGGSDDSSPQILKEIAASDPRVRVLENPARRTPHALNIGLRAARGAFIARMDAHTIYPDSYLRTGIARLLQGDVEWASGPALPFGTDPGSELVARALTTPLGRGGSTFRAALERERDVDTGFAGVWRRATLERHGGWDEEWVNDQDSELAARVREAGGRIVCIPEMAARYVPRNSLEAVVRQYGTYGIYRAKTAQRHPGTLRLSQLMPPALALSAVIALSAPSRALRRLAGAGIGSYGAVLILAAARQSSSGERSDVVALPIVWAAMHFSYGVGFFRGCARFGAPSVALRRILLGREPGDARSQEA